jgi:uncharacterized protein YggE
MSNQNTNKNAKIALVAGILAIGLLAVALVGSFPLANRAATQETELQHPLLNNNTSVKPTVSATGTATTSVKPDKVSVTVGVETNGTTAEEAAQRTLT